LHRQMGESATGGMNNWRPPLLLEQQFKQELIVTGVPWYLRFSLSLCDMEELLEERGLSVDHMIVWRWAQAYASESGDDCRDRKSISSRGGLSTRLIFRSPVFASRDRPTAEVVPDCIRIRQRSRQHSPPLRTLAEGSHYWQLHTNRRPGLWASRSHAPHRAGLPVSSPQIRCDFLSASR
jgi:hypothetical protein